MIIAILQYIYKSHSQQPTKIKPITLALHKFPISIALVTFMNRLHHDVVPILIQWFIVSLIMKIQLLKIWPNLIYQKTDKLNKIPFLDILIDFNNHTFITSLYQKLEAQSLPFFITIVNIPTDTKLLSNLFFYKQRFTHLAHYF